MSNPASPQNPGSSQPPAELSYSSPLTMPHVSGMATTAMILGIVGLVTSCVFIGFPLGLVALILGIISLVQINKHPGVLGGRGRAQTGIVLGICTLVGVPLIAVLLPSRSIGRELANRSYCAANVTGILKACVVYAEDNSDCFPMTPYTGTGYHVYFGTADTGTGAIPDSLRQLQSSPNSLGNPASCLWMLCVQGSVAVNNFRCLSDPNATAYSSPLQTASLHYYIAPTNQNQLSYSIASPWIAGPGGVTIPSPAWRNHTNASIPMMSDMAPFNGTGGRSFIAANASNPKALNSNNHSAGDGQEVGFGDCHVEWCRKPDVGPSGDFIFTHNSTAPGTTWSGTQSTGTTPIAPVDPLNDVQLIPARNLSTGAVQ